MIDLTNQDLSTAINLIIQEVNRGCWLAARRGAANGGIPVELPKEIAINAKVTARPGEVVVNSITASTSGGKTSVTTSGGRTQQQTSAGTQTSEGQTISTQSGENGNQTDNDYKEV